MYDPSQKVLAQCYKTFNIRNLLMFFIGRVFVPVKTLHPSLMFARKHRVYPSEVTVRVHFRVVSWPYSQTLTLAWRVLTLITNILKLRTLKAL